MNENKCPMVSNSAGQMGNFNGYKCVPSSLPESVTKASIQVWHGEVNIGWKSTVTSPRLVYSSTGYKMTSIYSSQSPPKQSLK